MTGVITPTQPFDTDVELRRRNRATVSDYMSRSGPSRLSRHTLFTEDGSCGLWTTDTGVPIVIRGQEKLQAHGVWSLRCFPDWVWINVAIYETQDPNRFWVECDGEGQILFPGYRDGHYRNHFIHSFVLDNGAIKEQYEFMNPVAQMHALGLEVPLIRREGIPT